MTTGDHTTYRDEVGAYLLGALSDAERASFEGHLVDCAECRHEVDRLRPAADLLPRSVEQVEPPPSLKSSLMEVVEREARERGGAAEGAGAPQRARPSLGERASFEGHLVDCAECRHEVDRLRPAADLLPRSVEQVEPPPSLKSSLMEVVEREARERGGAAEGAGAPQRARPSLGERLRGLLGGSLRPALTAAAILAAVVVGFGAQRLLSDDDSRTVVASVESGALPDASGRLKLQDDGKDGAILEVHGMPSPGANRVYQAWVERDGMVEPEPTFEVGADGGGAVAVPDDLSDAEAVHITREPRGGSRAPSEKPILTVRL